MQVLYSLLLLSLLATVNLFNAEQPLDQSNPTGAKAVTGTYKIRGRGGAGGTLKVLQLADGGIRFEIECYRGKPSYNSGEAGGIVALSEGRATYVTTEFGNRCEIVLRFDRNKVRVSQRGLDIDCGFGHGVTCDGLYYLKSRNPPKFDTE